MLDAQGSTIRRVRAESAVKRCVTLASDRSVKRRVTNIFSSMPVVHPEACRDCTAWIDALLACTNLEVCSVHTPTPQVGEQPIELPIFLLQARTAQPAVGQTFGSTAVVPQQKVIGNAEDFRTKWAVRCDAVIRF